MLRPRQRIRKEEIYSKQRTQSLPPPFAMLELLQHTGTADLCSVASLPHVSFDLGIAGSWMRWHRGCGNWQLGLFGQRSTAGQQGVCCFSIYT